MKLVLGNTKVVHHAVKKLRVPGGNLFPVSLGKGGDKDVVLEKGLHHQGETGKLLVQQGGKTLAYLVSTPFQTLRGALPLSPLPEPPRAPTGICESTPSPHAG